ncbi:MULTISPECIES: FAD/FMN-containing dehydrogenase [Pseudomonas]|uniref:FAD/FMN-containing dehydrogenase n=1 Tax=Pseudomonas TaxID=286 RepID=UPI003001D4AF
MKALMLLMLCLLSSAVLALEKGERLESWTLLDQFEQPYTLDNQLQVLLVARDMEGAEMLEAALQGQPKGYLQQRHAVFLADISKMPSLIAKMFAVPAMRDYNYRVLLDRESRVVPRYDVAESTVLWLQLKDGKLQELHNFTDAAALRGALEAAPQDSGAGD